MIKNYLYKGDKGVKVSELFANNSDYLERVVAKANSRPAGERYKAIQDGYIRLIISGGDANVASDTAANYQIPLGNSWDDYDWVSGGREEGGILANDAFSNKMLSGGMEGDGDYKQNVSSFVFDSIYNSPDNVTKIDQAKANNTIISMKKFGNKYSLKASQKEGVYNIYVPDAQGQPVSSGFTVDFNDWDGHVKAGQKAGYKEDKIPSSSAFVKKDWKGTKVGDYETNQRVIGGL